MIRLGRVAAAYIFLGGLASAIAVVWRGELPLVHPDPWLVMPFAERELWSLGVGLTIGALLVVATRWTVARWAWMRRLHVELRPIARGMTVSSAVAIAAFSSIGEELLFRGLLQPWVGLWAQGLIFGMLHYLPGPSRWSWAVSATLVGLGFGAVYQLTGSIAGPIAAHFVVNAVNLLYLKSHDPEARPPALGGLLGQRS